MKLKRDQSSLNKAVAHYEEVTESFKQKVNDCSVSIKNRRSSSRTQEPSLIYGQRREGKNNNQSFTNIKQGKISKLENQVKSIDKKLIDIQQNMNNIGSKMFSPQTQLKANKSEDALLFFPFKKPSMKTIQKVSLMTDENSLDVSH